MQKISNAISQFARLEASGGIVLILAMLSALVMANSGLYPFYSTFLETNLRIGAGDFEISKPAYLWINDGLMAIFFFLVGLEIKREVLAGELSTFDKAALPLLAAIGGMAVPAVVFMMINSGDPETIKGWAIPAATDIAFALGLLALFGSRAPVSLKIFLLAVAIIDDLGAIVIIAVFYTTDLSTNALTLALVAFALAVSFNRLKVKSFTPYLLVGLFMWACVLKSGVHATLAGVLIAMTIPMDEKEPGHSMLDDIEHSLHPWVAFLILPVFAFANAGVKLDGVSLADFANPLPLGIAAGLVIGKQVGIFGACWISIKLGIAKMPANTGWLGIYGIACLAGIGFTMSLFIGSLAFADPQLMNEVRLGVLSGSAVSAACGMTALWFALREPGRVSQPQNA